MGTDLRFEAVFLTNVKHTDMPKPRFPNNSDVLPLLEESDYPESARQILTAAVELFARKGYAATSVREIVEAADVTNPMLYYYFDSKEGLFLELNNYLFEAITYRVREVLESSGSFEERVVGIVRAHAEACLDAPVALQFVYFVLFGPEDSKPSFDVLEAREPMAAQIRGVFETAIEVGEFEPVGAWTPGDLTEQLLGTINVHLMRALKEAERFDTPGERIERMQEMLGPESRERLVRFFLRGVGYR